MMCFKGKVMCFKGKVRGIEQKRVIYVEKRKLLRLVLEWSKYDRVAEKEIGKVSWGLIKK